MEEELFKCKKCNEEKPISAFYVYKERRNPTCKICKSIESKERLILKKKKDKEKYTVPIGLTLSNRIKREENNNGYSRAFIVQTAIQMFIESDHVGRMEVNQRYRQYGKIKSEEE